MKISPTPWERETVQLREEGSAYEVVKDAEGATLFDTLNSNAAVIHEADDEGPHRWDEQGRVNLTLAAAAPELFDSLKEILAVRTGDGLLDPAAFIRGQAALNKAKGISS